MAAFHGKSGSAVFDGGTTANITNWTLNASADVVETSVMAYVNPATASSHWKSHLATYNDWTASITCIVDDGGLDPNLDADFAQDADGLTLQLHETWTGKKYYGNGIITNVSATVDKEDVARITYDIQGSGALTYASI